MSHTEKYIAPFIFALCSVVFFWFGMLATDPAKIAMADRMAIAALGVAGGCAVPNGKKDLAVDKAEEINVDLHNN